MNRDREAERRERLDAYGDAVYDAWRRGLNPDRVDPERIDDDWYAGHSREDCAAREVARIENRDSSDEEVGS